MNVTPPSDVVALFNPAGPLQKKTRTRPSRRISTLGTAASTPGTAEVEVIVNAEAERGKVYEGTATCAVAMPLVINDSSERQTTRMT